MTRTKKNIKRTNSGRNKVSKRRSKSQKNRNNVTRGKNGKPTKSRSKKNKSRSRGVAGKNYEWKVGDCVRPKGMPGHYVILKELNDSVWLMRGAARYEETIPKSVEFQGWEKIKC